MRPLKLLLKLIIVISLLINSAGQGYALRPMAAEKSRILRHGRQAVGLPVRLLCSSEKGERLRLACVQLKREPGVENTEKIQRITLALKEVFGKNAPDIIIFPEKIDERVASQDKRIEFLKGIVAQTGISIGYGVELQQDSDQTIYYLIHYDGAQIVTTKLTKGFYLFKENTHENRILRIKGYNIGILICAESLEIVAKEAKALSDNLSDAKPDLLIVPSDISKSNIKYCTGRPFSKFRTPVLCVNVATSGELKSGGSRFVFSDKDDEAVVLGDGEEILIVDIPHGLPKPKIKASSSGKDDDERRRQFQEDLELAKALSEGEPGQPTARPEKLVFKTEQDKKQAEALQRRKEKEAAGKLKEEVKQTGEDGAKGRELATQDFLFAMVLKGQLPDDLKGLIDVSLADEESFVNAATIQQIETTPTGPQGTAEDMQRFVEQQDSVNAAIAEENRELAERIVEIRKFALQKQAEAKGSESAQRLYQIASELLVFIKGNEIRKEAEANQVIEHISKISTSPENLRKVIKWALSNIFEYIRHAELVLDSEKTIPLSGEKPQAMVPAPRPVSALERAQLAVSQAESLTRKIKSEIGIVHRDTGSNRVPPAYIPKLRRYAKDLMKLKAVIKFLPVRFEDLDVLDIVERGIAPGKTRTYIIMAVNAGATIAQKECIIISVEEPAVGLETTITLTKGGVGIIRRLGIVKSTANLPVMDERIINEISSAA